MDSQKYKTNKRGPLPWKTKEIDKSITKLILGSFTSSDGMDYYYYGSQYNDFYLFLDYALNLSDKDIDIDESMKTSEIKEKIESCHKSIFVQLKNVLRDPKSDKNKIRKQIHQALLDKGFDICDLFLKVYMKDPTKDNDTNIALKSPDTVYDETLLKSINESNIKTIYCTSAYVRNRFNIIKKRIGIKDVEVVTLVSPSRLMAKMSTYEKLKMWKKLLS